jgi:8-oxo-dGTP pyrophosphatase MutT (NUDIX family)
MSGATLTAEEQKLLHGVIQGVDKKHAESPEVIQAIHAAFIIGRDLGLKQKKKDKAVPASGIRRAGAWIFAPDLKRVVLVQSKKNTFGAPKGRFEKTDVTDVKARDREVEEETGLKPADLVYEETTVKDGDEVCYWVATLKNGDAKLQPRDTKEIRAVFLCPVDAAHVLLDKNRSSLLKLATEVFGSIAAGKTATNPS